MKVGASAVPTLTEERTAVTVGLAYAACDETVVATVVVFALVVVTVTVAAWPVLRPETVNGKVEPLTVPAATVPAEVVGVKVVPTA